MKTAVKILIPIGVMFGTTSLAINIQDMTIYDGLCIVVGFIGGCVSLVREVHEALEV
jgi:hypothetical protein